MTIKDFVKGYVPLLDGPGSFNQPYQIGELAQQFTVDITT